MYYIVMYMYMCVYAVCWVWKAVLGMTQDVVWSLTGVPLQQIMCDLHHVMYLYILCAPYMELSHALYTVCIHAAHWTAR